MPSSLVSSWFASCPVTNWRKRMFGFRGGVTRRAYRRPVASTSARRRAASSSVSWPSSSRQRQLRGSIVAGTVHPCVVAEAEHVLRREDRQRGARAEREAQQLPVVVLRKRGGERRRVVGRGVDDRVLTVVLRPVRVVGRARERPEEHDHAREAELVAQSLDIGRDHPEVLGDHRQLAELGLDRPEQRSAGAGRPVALGRALRLGRDRPVGREAAEVVDARDVDERERAPQPFDPPAVAVGRDSVPVEERVAPVLTLGAEVVGRRAGDDAVPEQLGMREVVAAGVGRVDRHVADQAHAALGRVVAQAGPFPLEAHLVLHGPRAGEGGPVLEPVGVPPPEVRRGACADPRPRPGEQAGPAGERRGRRIGRAERIRRPEWQHLPPRLPGSLEPVDEPVRALAEAPVGERGRVQQDPARTAKLHDPTVYRSRDAENGRTCAASPQTALRPESRSRTSTRRWTAGAIPRRRRSASVCSSRRRSSGTATTSCGPSCATGAPGRAAGWSVSWWHSATIAGSATSTSPTSAGGSSRSRPGPTRTRPGSTSTTASSRAGRSSCRASSPRALRSSARATPTSGGPRRPRSAAKHREDAVTLPKPLELDVDRERARFGSWYELFPRSWGGFKGVAEVLPQLAELGFDVVYLPPVHPIGVTNRKGRNNALVAERRRPGQPVGDRRQGGRP